MFLPPWQETFADAGAEVGGGGGDHLEPFWDHLKIILGPFGIHFRTPLCLQNIFPKQLFFPPEMAHTNFVSSIRITPSQSLIWIENDERMFSNLAK